MKIQQEKAILEIEGFENKGQKFAIKQSARAFEILSSNIYSDKPLAVVRELGCNARDAHIAAGKEDVPFDVHLPNQFEPWFSIRDYGIGLSHDQIMTLYVTYFDSTKGDSNEMVGALGLGSKSPFSYTDQFTVTSWFDGTKRQYSAYLDEDRCPAITPLDNGVPTTECNGVEVYMAVKPSDFSTFANRAKKVFHRFPTLPKITGTTDVELIKVEYALEGVNYRVRKSGNFNSSDHKGCYAIQGAVAYPIDVAAFAMPLSHQLDTLFRNCPIDIIFPIGELNITASRERLNYDKITQKNLIDVGQSVLDDLPKKYESVLAGAKTLWEAKLLFQQWWEIENNSSHIREILDNKMIWKGQQIDRSSMSCKMFDEIIDMDDKGKPLMIPKWAGSSDLIPSVKEVVFGEVTVFGSRDMRKTNPRGSTYKSHEIPVSKKTKIILKDRKHKNFGKFMKHHFGQGEVPYGTEWYVLDFLDSSKLQQVMDSLGNPPDDVIMKTSMMDDPPAAPKVKDANGNPTAKLVRKLMYVSRLVGNSDFECTETTTDMNEGGLFVVMYEKRMVMPGHESEPKGKTSYLLPKVLYQALNLGFMDSGEAEPKYKRIFAVNSTFKNSLIKNDKWKTVWDYLIPAIATIMNDEDKMNSIRFLASYNDASKTKALWQWFDEMSHTNPDKDKSKFLQARAILLEHVDMVKDDFKMDDPTISGMAEVCRRFLEMIREAREVWKLPEVSRDIPKNVLDFIASIDKTYPLLADIAEQHGNAFGQFDNARSIHYINLCDACPSLVTKADLKPKLNT